MRSLPVTLLSLLASLAIAACAPPTIPDGAADPSADLPEGVTEESGDITSPRVSTTADAGAPPDAAPAAKPASDAATDAADAAPAEHTFTVGSTDCNGGHCRAGYDGTKDAAELSTATKQCVGHGFARATDFTLVAKQPGGKFCSFTSGAYRCDGSCSGCNPMGTITCASP